ncbi:SH2 domain-containing protein 3C-like isoform X3 [Nerophis lumbriciformis]|uniref:SH2 domain-containing protein 3C-like isoform X3 n=1 Tax=Nerophis lumbriciformis TaxID=546530 RepID=UPI002AE07E16|nr:SH2 domain-containing protein 3C-like isoform X3 [Nerophis lumbriciformis]
MRSNMSHVQPETQIRQCDVAESSNEYVKFSKDKFWLEPPSEDLKKQLEEELKLCSSNLRSHAWYHGPIPREVSESLLSNHGDFLIRDSDSSPGDFVLTARWDQKTNHFPISKTLKTRVQYSLDRESFDSMPALVRFYVGGRGPLTCWSPAQIHRPANRTLPLSYLETVFGAALDPCPIPPKERGERPQQHLRSDEKTRLPAENNLPSRSSTLSLAGSGEPVVSCTAPISAPALRPEAERDGAPALRPEAERDGVQPDADGSCYTELYPGPQSFVERLRAEERPLGAEGVHSPPVVETVSSIRPAGYRSALMPAENKPLEVGILQRVKAILAQVDPKTAARHITKCDCTLARILEVRPEVQRMMGVSSGVELLTLPHGQRLRLDLLERLHVMATTLAVNLLGCTGTAEERAGLLHGMIRTAAELKSNMGNMFGFAAVMRALELPQVTRLEHTWATLRQRHTEGAILYQKTLRPFMKSLNEGKESCPLSSTSFPHVLPLLYLLERGVALGEGAEPWETAEDGVDVVMLHLGAARTVAQLGDVYRSNAESKLQELEWDLYKNVYGQHLAQDIISEEVVKFLQNKSPEKPLVLSFHGSSGTGKTLVSSMLGSHLYGSAMSSPYVHRFIPALHFPSAGEVDQYRVQLKNWVQGNLTACARSVFIFDEMERMPRGLLDVLEPFLGPSHVVFGTNYRKAFYVFISTAGEDVVNRVALEHRRAGRDREEITSSDLQDAVAQAVYDNNSSGLFQSSIIRHKLITSFVPFLPLSRRHVERSQLCQLGACQRSDVVRAVGGDMTYTPAPGHFFSASGCKSVTAKINLFL